MSQNMSEPQDIVFSKRSSTHSTGSPIGSPGGHFLVPSPVPTRRNRTYSAHERAVAGPSHRGVIKSFCREKGHGFITPNDGGEALFVHVSDVDEEFVPKPGDEVSFKKCPCPPKNEKFSAVHVKIISLAEGVPHERWDSPVTKSPKAGTS